MVFESSRIKEMVELTPTTIMLNTGVAYANSPLYFNANEN
jgi:hypothetical protein